MHQSSAFSTWASHARAFLAAFLLVLASASQASPATAAELNPADFDPLYDLPPPPAWYDTEDFATTAAALQEQIATGGKVRVRVDLRLPSVETQRMDEDQLAQWEEDQAAAQQDLLDSLPDGSYQRVGEQLAVTGLVQVGQRTAVAEAEADGEYKGTMSLLDDPNAVAQSEQGVTASSLTLEVGEAALDALMASPLVANVQGSTPNAKIAAGDGHSLLLGADGSLWVWGVNTSGQLGDGTTTKYRATPTPILLDFVAVSAGWYHSLALKSDGSLWAWGSNGSGQLGDGTTTNRTTPKMILTGGVVTLAGGGYHSLALKNDGSLWAWGSSNHGQLGDGTIGGFSTVPKQILTGVVAVSAGWNYSLALKSDGSLWAWGDNSSGQLGDGTTTNRSMPTQILASGVVAMTSGGGHTLAIKSDGSLWAWGSNSYGQLGDGTSGGVSTTPKKILISGVDAVAAGMVHTLSVKSDGSLWAWGYNGYGQLGDGTTTNSNLPKQILTGGVTAVAAGKLNTFAFKSDGSLWAWGHNGSGQLGDGTIVDRSSPALVTGVAAYPPNAPTDLGTQTVSSTGINLTWTDASSNELGFQVERRNGEGSWALLATQGANYASYVDGGVTEGETYGYRVRAYNTAGISDYTPEVITTVLPAPTNLATSIVNDIGINLTWTDNSLSETKYTVMRKDGTDGTWAEIATLVANTTAYSDTDLYAPFTYFYRIRASNTASYSDYSNEASATTIDGAPSGLTASAVSDTRIHLTWQDNSASETAYPVERKIGTEGNWAVIGILAADTTTFTDTGLSAPINYSYRLRAAYPVGYSSYSNEASAATPIPMPLT